MESPLEHMAMYAYDTCERFNITPELSAAK